MVFLPKLVEVDLQVGQLDAGAFFADFLDDLPEVVARVFQGNVEAVEGLPQHVLHLGCVHRFHPEPAVEQAGDGFFKVVQRAQVFFADDEQDAAGQFGAVQQRHDFDELPLLFGAAEYENLLELVEDQVQRAQVNGVGGVDDLRRHGLHRPAQHPAHGFGKGGQDALAAAHEDRQPVGGVVAAGQSALHQAGFARTRLSVHQYQPVLVDHAVQLLDLFVAAEEH